MPALRKRSVRLTRKYYSRGGAAAPSARAKKKKSKKGKKTKKPKSKKFNDIITASKGGEDLLEELEHAARQLGLICPISQQVFEDPVETYQGQIYEKKSIMTWLEGNNTKGMSPKKSNPQTRSRLNKDLLYKPEEHSINGYIFMAKLNAFKKAAIREANKGSSTSRGKSVVVSKAVKEAKDAEKKAENGKDLLEVAARQVGLICPLTKKIIKDPVETYEQQIYEKKAIVVRLQGNRSKGKSAKETNPQTGSTLNRYLLFNPKTHSVHGNIFMAKLDAFKKAVKRETRKGKSMKEIASTAVKEANAAEKKQKERWIPPTENVLHEKKEKELYAAKLRKIREILSNINKSANNLSKSGKNKNNLKKELQKLRQNRNNMIARGVAPSGRVANPVDL